MDGEGEVHGLSAAIGALQSSVHNLAAGQGELFARVGKVSEGIVRLEEKVAHIKPEFDAYRTERDQRAGAAIWRGRMWKGAALVGSALGSGQLTLYVLRWLWVKG